MSDRLVGRLKRLTAKAITSRNATAEAEFKLYLPKLMSQLESAACKGEESLYLMRSSGCLTWAVFLKDWADKEGLRLETVFHINFHAKQSVEPEDSVAFVLWWGK